MGLIGAGLMGVMVDKTKRFEEITKGAFGFATIFLIFMIEVNIEFLLSFGWFKITNWFKKPYLL